MASKEHATKTTDERHPAMDYAQHEATWKGFVAMTKWGIIALAFLCVALYCFIEAQQPVLGTLLLLVLPVGAVAVFATRARAAA